MVGDTHSTLQLLPVVAELLLYLEVLVCWILVPIDLHVRHVSLFRSNRCTDSLQTGTLVNCGTTLPTFAVCSPYLIYFNKTLSVG